MEFPAKRTPKPPIRRSRARITSVTPMAEAAEIPNVPSANTSLASRAPRPPGKGARSDSQPAVHAATVCQKGNRRSRKLVMSANSQTIPTAAQSDVKIANNREDKCRRQNAPANRSEAAMNRSGLESFLRNGRLRRTAETGYFSLYRRMI